MEREPGSHEGQSSIESNAHGNWFEQAVEKNHPITLSARQVDQIIASLGLCTASIFSLLEAMNSDGHQSLKQKMLSEASKSIEEASGLIEDLTSGLMK